MKKWTDDEKDFLRQHYPNKGKEWCATQLHRGEASVRWMASELGLKQNKQSEFFKDWQRRAAQSKIGAKRPEQAEVMKNLHAEGKLQKTDKQRKETSIRFKEWHKTHEHPRGATGLVLSPESRARQRQKCRETWAAKSQDKKAEHTMKVLKARAANGNLSMPRRKTTWKAGWRDVGGKRRYFRSLWEANYARYLEFLKTNNQIIDWEHEPKTFWFEDVKRGCMSYLPDFCVTGNDGREIYHEVKGWMDVRSMTKIERMKEYYPSVPLVVIDSAGYGAIAQKVAGLIEGWEK